MRKRDKNKQKTYWFFRILTIWVLVAIGFLMLGESLNIFRFYIWELALSKVYPVIIIFSTVILWNYKYFIGKLMWLFLFFLVFGGFFSVGIYTSLNQYNKNGFSQNIKNNIYRSPLVNFSIENFIWSINLEWDKISKFVEWKYKSDRNLVIDSHMDSWSSYFGIEEEKTWNILQDYKTDLDLKLDKNQLVDIYIKNFLGQHIIDMSKIYWKESKINLWWANLDIILSDDILSGNLLQIQSVFSNITIQIPSDVWIRLYNKRLAGMLWWDMVKKWKNYYESTNIDDAKKILNLDIKSAVWLVDIVRIQK